MTIRDAPDLLPAPGQRGPLPRDDSVNTLLSALLHAPVEASPPPPACVRGVDGAGVAHEVAVTAETETVALSGLGLRTASLVALSVCGADALRELSLAANALATLDLAPLAACPRLAVLALNSNGLRAIDLRPLASCPALERLWLHDNKLEELDLAPLAAATALRSLYIDDNRLHAHTLDLRPLARCTQLRALRLAGNRLDGRLDVTPLLADPALSQLATDPTVRLVATGASSQARVSPALRRRVLDISFTPAPVPRPSSPPSLASPASPASPSASRTRRSSPPSPQLLSPSRSRRKPDAAPARTITPPSFGAPASRAAMPRTPPPERAAPAVAAVLVGFRRLARYAAEDALARRGKITLTAVEAQVAATAPATLLDSHLALLHAPQPAVLRKVASAAKAHTPVVVFGTERYRASNATLLKETLADATHFCTDPLSDTDAELVFELGLACARRRVGAVSARQESAAPAPGTERRQPSLREPRSVEDGSGAGAGDADLGALSSASSSDTESEEAPGVVRRRRRSSGGADDDESDEESGATARSFWSEVSTRLKLFRRPPYSSPKVCFSRSPSLPLLQIDAIHNGLPLRDRPFSPVVSSSSALSRACPEMRMHSANKTRAERAALEAVFHDLGGEGTVESFAGIARTCGLPKCAARLLFNAVLSALEVVERTTPETGVPTAPSDVSSGGEDGPSPYRRISTALFMQYWETRLHHYSADMRLFNVMRDSRMARREQEREKHDRLGQDTGVNRQRTSSSLSSSTVSTNNDAPSVRVTDSALRPMGADADVDDLYRQCSSDSTSSSCSVVEAGRCGDGPQKNRLGSPQRRRSGVDNGEDGTAGLEGCDAAVGELVHAFMYGRSGRFGMFALVKLSEAIAIGTALVLMGLRGECGSRVGGFARPVGAHEVCHGKLNAALISAESGIFEGVATSLAMDKLRNIKGTFASEAAPESVVAADACALNYALSTAEVAHYHAQRRMLMPRGVEALMNVHCRGRKHMSLTEFAVMHTLSDMIESSAAADYFFSTMDADQDAKITLADVQHFHSEKGRLLLGDQMALAGLYEVWACLVDNVRPANAASGIKRSEFRRLSGRDRKTITECVLFRDDRHATLNIRATVLLEGGDPRNFCPS